METGIKKDFKVELHVAYYGKTCTVQMIGDAVRNCNVSCTRNILCLLRPYAGGRDPAPEAGRPEHWIIFLCLPLPCGKHSRNSFQVWKREGVKLGNLYRSLPVSEQSLVQS
jgi:hypothetical protein